ncbi:RluA family pseudouridine synthase [Sphingobacterium sp. SRCM116780]|uniref:RluA family pseudouridine synthase n=1 Tax=Sphingobacterium sp. SRCM116780 TaxID=2907623 RepID=UPI001F47F53E|nr:RluA family pseudouridine synthase [Sphingobacterium sp. SRCM116780]UIR54502.1 RluA family pseudouridine synthase [Sphingobacterium sp. SRCM116780]
MKGNSLRKDPFFHTFNKEITTIPLPINFTFPFCYEPHILAKMASESVQKHITTQRQWLHNFGLNSHGEGQSIGKMFGVLVVEDQEKNIGFLAAFSGKLAGKNDHEYFVPPIFDMLTENSFFLVEEENLNKLNKQIIALEQNPLLTKLDTAFKETKMALNLRLAQFKEDLKIQKHNRKQVREESKRALSQEEYDVIEKDLIKQSLRDKHDLHIFQKQNQEEIAKAEVPLLDYLNGIASLKEERKRRSSALQHKLFEQYNFRNAKGETENVIPIFKAFNNLQPPAGSGECAAPKLLQYAYLNKYKPLALAEFWWGQSPSAEVRRHQHYYPACRNKCEPILGFMLQGLAIDENPMLQSPDDTIEIPIIYEDESLLVINKPEEFLSVPGIHIQDSVYTRMLNKYPDAGPLIVHRLDMSTSGILVLAKNKEVHKALQSQFINHRVVKYYIALLDGIIKEEFGEISLPLHVDLDDRPRQLVCYDYGKKAITKWEKLSVEDGKTRIKYFPVTGRTHQLRVHSAHPNGMNCPIVGDDLYGQKSNRLHLHAAYIEFNHPVSNERISFTVNPKF